MTPSSPTPVKLFKGCKVARGVEVPCGAVPMLSPVVADRITGALWGMFIADALAMPSHWFYGGNRRSICSVFHSCKGLASNRQRMEEKLVPHVDRRLRYHDHRRHQHQFRAENVP